VVTLSCLVLLFFSAASPINAVQESLLTPEMAPRLVREMESRCRTGFFEGKDHVPLYYLADDAFLPSGGNALVLVTGRNESVYKYAELIHDLKKDGVVFAYDHRGQGRSGRMLDDPLKGHVDDFTDYVADFKLFIKMVVRPERFRRTVVVAHSMGGAVAALALASGDMGVSGLILSSPMVAINTGKLPRALARSVAAVLDRLGYGTSYLPGGGYHVREFKTNNDLTSSRSRFLYARELERVFPEIALGDATNRWLREAFSVTDALMASAGGITVPVLLLQATEDTVVDLPWQKRFCEALPRCRLEQLAGSRHEILMERDGIRDQALRQVGGFWQGEP